MSSEDVWDKFVEFAEKLRGLGFYVELIRTDDEIFERYVITIERDKKNRGTYYG